MLRAARRSGPTPADELAPACEQRWRRRTPRARRARRARRGTATGPTRYRARRRRLSRARAVTTSHRVEAHEPLTVGVGAVEMQRLAAAPHASAHGQYGISQKNSSIPSTASRARSVPWTPAASSASKRCTVVSHGLPAGPEPGGVVGGPRPAPARWTGDQQRVGEQVDARCEPRRTSGSGSACDRFATGPLGRALADDPRHVPVNAPDVREQIGDGPARTRRHGGVETRGSRRGSQRVTFARMASVSVVEVHTPTLARPARQLRDRCCRAC